MLQIGDRVKVINSKLAYLHYQSWIENNAPEFLLYWKRNRFPLELFADKEDFNNFLVIAKAPESSTVKVELCLIQAYNGDVYLLRSDALQQIHVMFSVGSVVSLYDNRLVYTEYEVWLDRNAPTLKAQWKRDEYPIVGEKYKLVKQAPKAEFSPFCNQILCAIQSCEETPSVFLVDKNALFLDIE
ncbi:MAG: hypothetical protein ACI37Z_05000 [Candidatus Gastranaerophilaceae bacterium]